MKLISFVLFSLFASCSNAEKDITIQFSRFGITIEKQIDGHFGVFSEGKEISYRRQNIGRFTLLKFSWSPNTAYVITFKNKTVQVVSPLKATPIKIDEVALGNVEKLVRQGNSLDTDVAFSPSNRFVGIGSYTGEFLMYDLSLGKKLWDISINEGVIKKVIFSSDSKRVFIGEQSMDGKILCFDVESGKQVWSYTLSDDLNRSAAPRANDPYGIYTLPGVFHLEYMNEKLMVAGLHSWYEGGKAKKRSKLYQFSRDGEKIWEFPKKEPLYGNIQYFSSSENFTVFNVGDLLEGDKSGLNEQSLVMLNTKNGTLLDSKIIPSLPPYFPKVSFWQSVSIDQSEKFANMGVYDGRGFIFNINDQKFSKTVSLELGKPVLVNDIPITAGIPYTNSLNSHAVFSVVQTSVPYSFSSVNNVNEPPALHPAAGTLFFYDREGMFVWKYHNGLIYSAIHSSQSGEWFIATLDNKKENRDAKQFGITLFRYTNQLYEDIFDYHTEGPSFFRGTISNDGNLIGVIETPYLLNDKETIKGTYKVHIVL